MKIALIDSGVGGLHVLNTICKHFKQCEYLYIVDNLFAPYGSHSNINLQKRIICLAKAIENKVSLIVLACNTASLVIKDKIKDIIKVPVIFIFPNIRHSKYSHLVMATPLSIDCLKNSNFPENAILLGCDTLAMDVEKELSEGYFDNSRLINMLLPYTKLKHCHLGCTHYLYKRNVIAKIMPKAKLYDGTEDVVKKIRKLHLKKSKKKPAISIFFTGKNQQSLYAKIIANNFPEILGFAIAFTSKI